MTITGHGWRAASYWQEHTIGRPWWEEREAKMSDTVRVQLVWTNGQRQTRNGPSPMPLGSSRQWRNRNYATYWPMSRSDEGGYDVHG